MQDALLEQALAAYGLKGRAELIRHNENRTYRVRSPRGDVLLRIHQRREGFSLGVLERGMDPKRLIAGEMALVAALSREMPLQRPLTNRAGALVTDLEGTTATALTWLPGQTLEQRPPDMQTYRRLGGMLARMHAAMAALGESLPRYRYDAALVRGVGRRLEADSALGRISPEQMETLRRAVEVIAERVQAEPAQLVHADLSSSNLLLTERGLVPIDFGLSGYGPWIMDLGFLLTQHGDPAAREAIVQGYEERGDRVDPRRAEPYFALSILLFMATHGDMCATWPDYGDHIDRWSRETFLPLIQDRPFILLNGAS